MRTTLTLDDDVVALLRRVQTRTKKSFKQVVNEALRAGLTVEATRASERRPVYRTRSHPSGKSLVGSLECVADALALAEGDEHK